MSSYVVQTKRVLMTGHDQLLVSRNAYLVDLATGKSLGYALHAMVFTIGCCMK